MYFMTTNYLHELTVFGPKVLSNFIYFNSFNRKKEYKYIASQTHLFLLSKQSLQSQIKKFKKHTKFHWNILLNKQRTRIILL